jgi:hypothetical protein
MNFEKMNPDENAQKRVWDKLQAKITAEQKAVPFVEFPDTSENNAIVYTKKKSTFWFQFASVAACLAIVGTFVFAAFKNAPDEDSNKLTEGISIISDEQDIASDWQSIKVGWTRDEVLNVLGEPTASGSGVFFDTWHLADTTDVTIFYRSENGEGVVEQVNFNEEQVQPPVKNVDIVPVEYDENTPLGDGEWVLDYACPVGSENPENIDDYAKRIVFHNPKIGIFVADIDSNDTMTVVKSLDLSKISDSLNITDNENLFIKVNNIGDTVMIKLSEDGGLTWFWSLYDDKLILTSDESESYLNNYFDTSLPVIDPYGKLGNGSGFTNPIDENFVSWLYIARNSGDTFKNLSFSQHYVGDSSENDENVTYVSITWYPFETTFDVIDTAIVETDENPAIQDYENNVVTSVVQVTQSPDATADNGTQETVTPSGGITVDDTTITIDATDGTILSTNE